MVAAAEESPEFKSVTVAGESSPSSAESSFRELDDAFLQTQARNWLGEVLHIRLDEGISIGDLLADGELLFQVSEVIWSMLPKSWVDITPLREHEWKSLASSKSTRRYMPYYNVDSFLRICQVLGLAGIDLFTPSDVVEKRDTWKVCICIRSLSKKARSRNLTVPDFDSVTCTVAMPTDMVECIRKSLEFSQGSLSVSTSHDLDRRSRSRSQPNSGADSAGDNGYSSDSSDEVESNYVVAASHSPHESSLNFPYSTGSLTILDSPVAGDYSTSQVVVHSDIGEKDKYLHNECMSPSAAESVGSVFSQHDVDFCLTPPPLLPSTGDEKKDEFVPSDRMPPYLSESIGSPCSLYDPKRNWKQTLPYSDMLDLENDEILLDQCISLVKAQSVDSCRLEDDTHCKLDNMASSPCFSSQNSGNVLEIRSVIGSENGGLNHIPAQQNWEDTAVEDSDRNDRYSRYDRTCSLLAYDQNGTNEKTSWDMIEDTDYVNSASVKGRDMNLQHKCVEEDDSAHGSALEYPINDRMQKEHSREIQSTCTDSDGSAVHNQSSSIDCRPSEEKVKDNGPNEKLHPPTTEKLSIPAEHADFPPCEALASNSDHYLNNEYSPEDRESQVPCQIEHYSSFDLDINTAFAPCVSAVESIGTDNLKSSQDYAFTQNLHSSDALSTEKINSSNSPNDNKASSISTSLVRDDVQNGTEYQGALFEHMTSQSIDANHDSSPADPQPGVESSDAKEPSYEDLACAENLDKEDPKCVMVDTDSETPVRKPHRTLLKSVVKGTALVGVAFILLQLRRRVRGTMGKGSTQPSAQQESIKPSQEQQESGQAALVQQESALPAQTQQESTQTQPTQVHQGSTSPSQAQNANTSKRGSQEGRKGGGSKGVYPAEKLRFGF